MNEYQAEEARPDPRSTINSYRSFGYSMSTAIADIIDNSISAGATKISLTYHWAGRESYITITDNGRGMTKAELVAAMKPGSRNPDEIRDAKDLGRFGMGLKTASFSQCKRLTVVSKKDGEQHHRCWDIEYVLSKGDWLLLDYLSNPSLSSELDAFVSGTTIIWEKTDRITGDSESSNEAVKEAFYREFIYVREHVAMVFHRFLEKKELQILFNSTPIEGWNPFLLNLDPKPETGPVEVLPGNVEVTFYILPHMSRIGQEQYQRSGGPLGWYQQQGFYIYRGDRLLVAGDWLDIDKKREYSKLVRISVNFPNAGDFDWNLDIKKSTATPPIALRRDLSRIARLACMKSAKVYNWRGQKQLASTDNKQPLSVLWTEELNRDGISKYKINRQHPLISKAMDAGGEGQKLFLRSLKLIEDNIPLELIFFNHNEDPSQHEAERPGEIPSDALIQLAAELYQISIAQSVPANLAASQIMNAVPFNQFPLIQDYLK